MWSIAEAAIWVQCLVLSLLSDLKVVLGAPREAILGAIGLAALPAILASPLKASKMAGEVPCVGIGVVLGNAILGLGRDRLEALSTIRRDPDRLALPPPSWLPGEQACLPGSAARSLRPSCEWDGSSDLRSSGQAS